MTNEEAKAFLDNLKICINEHPVVADWLVEIADRKTEPTHDLRTETHECVKDTHDKTEPQICDTCRYYNDYIPCGSTPSACKEADKFAEEFAVALMKLKPQTEREGE